MNRIVVKIGSNVLTRPDGYLDVTRISSFVDQIARIRALGMDVILVSSGAVACGRSLVASDLRMDSVQQRQLYSAVGQVRLMNLYSDLFRSYDITIGQVLTMKESFATRREYLNQRCCMDVMLRNRVLPIVNENDTVSVSELMFTDNDELSGLVATMMEADLLVILSNIDGIYDGSPEDPASRVIPEVHPHEDLSRYISPEKSKLGRGGMLSKCHTAIKVAAEGIRVIIANGKRPDILTAIVENRKELVCTQFVPRCDGVSSVKKWIAHSEGFAKGTVRVDRNAAEILKGDKAASLLFVGVKAVTGDFEEGDIISVVDEAGAEIALGKSNYDAITAKSLIGQREQKPLIHYNYLYLL